MSFTYAEFKTYLGTFLWKSNDTVLLANLDNLIKMGTAELDRKLVISRRESTATLSFAAAEASLPSDFKQAISIFSDADGTGAYSFVTTATIANEAVRNKTHVVLPIYSIRGRDVILAHSYAGTGSAGELSLVYRSTLPDFETDDSSWLADEFLDLLVYTVLKHTAPFLREDDRVGLWSSMATDALQSVLEEDAFNINTGSPMSMNIARPASPLTTRGIYSR